MTLSHPTGNANVRAVLSGLCDAASLESFHTTIATYDRNIWDRMSRTSLGRDFARRRFDPAAAERTYQRPLRELVRMIAGQMRASRLTRPETGWASVDSVYHDLDRHVAKYLRRSDSAAVYAYEDGALASFDAAQKLGKLRFYDLPIGYWRAARKMLEVERQRWPAWQSTLEGLSNSDSKLDRKDAELAAADQIYVASSFTRDTLQDYREPLAPVEVIPYGFPPVGPVKPPADDSAPLRLLFVGGLSQRKGLADVIAAADRLSTSVTLTIVGRRGSGECRPLDEALSRHRWIESLPHSKILETMRSHDVLLFPSLFEGFGLVITEAMSQGTPVVTTDRTAGPDVITDGHDGWIVPAGDTVALVDRINCLANDRDAVRHVGLVARATAAARPWTIYQKAIAASVAARLNKRLVN